MACFTDGVVQVYSYGYSWLTFSLLTFSSSLECPSHQLVQLIPLVAELLDLFGLLFYHPLYYTIIIGVSTPEGALQAL